MSRTFDLNLVLEMTEPYRDTLHGFYPEFWIYDTRNVALTNEHGDIALFEWEQSGLMSGHYFFKSRGRQAVNAAKAFLNELFTNEEFGVIIVRGLTPLQKLGARWMNKQLKFKSYGVVNTVAGPCELVILTKQEWLETN